MIRRIGIPKGGLRVQTLKKFQTFAKAEPNSQSRGIYIRNNLIRIWFLLICKLSRTTEYVDTALQFPVLYAISAQLGLLNHICRMYQASTYSFTDCLLHRIFNECFQ
jgi:hypothetical protein